MTKFPCRFLKDAAVGIEEISHFRRGFQHRSPCVPFRQRPPGKLVTAERAPVHPALPLGEFGGEGGQNRLCAPRPPGLHHHDGPSRTARSRGPCRLRHPGAACIRIGLPTPKSQRFRHHLRLWRNPPSNCAIRPEQSLTSVPDAAKMNEMDDLAPSSPVFRQREFGSAH